MEGRKCFLNGNLRYFKKSLFPENTYCVVIFDKYILGKKVSDLLIVGFVKVSDTLVHIILLQEKVIQHFSVSFNSVIFNFYLNIIFVYINLQGTSTILLHV